MAQEASGTRMPRYRGRPRSRSRAADLATLEADALNLARGFETLNDAAGRQAAQSLTQFRHGSGSCPIRRGRGAPIAVAGCFRWRGCAICWRQFSPTPLDMSAVPPELGGHLLSKDGYYALYIYPTRDLWQENHLASFMTSVEAAVKTVPKAPPVTGIASDIYHTTDAIHAAFYRATVYALSLIFILVLLDFRKLGPTLAAVSVLGLGLPMLLTAMGYFNITWNFANFFGLPILIGAGHEYGRIHGPSLSGSKRPPASRLEPLGCQRPRIALVRVYHLNQLRIFLAIGRAPGP